MADETKLARIRALLAKAESTEHEGERRVYEEKATELIAKYGIDAALLAAERQEREEVQTREIIVDGTYQGDKRVFLHQVFTSLGCQTFAFLGGPTIRVKVFGYDADLDRAELLYTSLLIQAMRGMQHAPQGGNARRTMANRRVWFAGFQSEVVRRIREAERRAQEDAQAPEGVSTALVLRDRSAAVKDSYQGFLDEERDKGGRIVKSRSTYSGSMTSYRQGQTAGARADIGHGRVGGNRRALA